MTVQSFWRVDAKDTLEVLLTNYLGHRLPDEHHPFAAFSVIYLAKELVYALCNTKTGTT